MIYVGARSMYGDAFRMNDDAPRMNDHALGGSVLLSDAVGGKNSVAVSIPRANAHSPSAIAGAKSADG